MFLTDLDCDEVRKEVYKLLKSIGVLKHRLKKSEFKQVEKKENGVFKIRLEKIKQKQCRLFNHETLIKIPIFLEEACSFIRRHIDTEGLFRKPGLAIRQKELKEYFTKGGRLSHNCDYNVTDVANLLKQFFRELPEPCIPYVFHDSLLKCLDLKGQQKEMILLVILLLPLEYMLTLAYLMQFLEEVASRQERNRMDVTNLAIVWTPNLMPFKPGHTTDKVTLDKRLTIIKILIENSNSIGTVPEYVFEHLSNWQPSTSLSSHDELEISRNKEKKKKRRSGSLTRMLSGIKRMVGRSMSPEQEVAVTPEQTATYPAAHTPRILSTAKKRKASNSNLPGFSAKKRRDLLESLPQRAILPDICYTTTHLTPRVLIAQTNDPEKEDETKRRSRFYTGKTPEVELRRKSRRSLSGTRLRLSHFGLGKKNKKKAPALEDSGLETTTSLDALDLTSSSEDYVRISRREYEDIKNRVSSIESRISSEFENIVGVSMSDLELTPERTVSSIKTVQSVYERTLESAEKFNSPTSDELAKKLNRELRIRGSSEKKVIRSPSARKIGTMRRKSRENAPMVKRNLSLNIPDRLNPRIQFYPINSLRRGKPNTVHNGLREPQILSQSNSKLPYNTCVSSMNPEPFEINDSKSNDFDFMNFGVLTRSQTRRASSFHGCDLSKIPNMTNYNQEKPLTPTSVTTTSDNINWKTAEDYLRNEKSADKSITGRPSIAKIRSQNAGMVMAKAKLFSTMVEPDKSARSIAFKSGTDRSKPKEIKKRNSSKSSKDRKVNLKSDNKLGRENSLKQNHTSRFERQVSLSKEKRSLYKEKENLPSQVRSAQGPTSRTPQRMNKTSALEGNRKSVRTPGKTVAVNSPLRERPKFNNTHSSTYRPLTVSQHHKPSVANSPRLKANVTPRKSPRQLLLKSKLNMNMNRP